MRPYFGSNANNTPASHRNVSFCTLNARDKLGAAHRGNLTTPVQKLSFGDLRIRCSLAAMGLSTLPDVGRIAWSATETPMKVSLHPACKPGSILRRSSSNLCNVETACNGVAPGAQRNSSEQAKFSIERPEYFEQRANCTVV
jgi:hypothetical protein